MHKQTMFEDVPIQSRSQDDFGRTNAVHRCASVLADIRSERAFVIGLSGAWGSGKTSFLNMVREELLSRPDKPVIVDFNAWLYSSQEQLVRQFFSEVTHALGKDTGKRLAASTANEIGKALTEYSDTIADKGTDLLGTALTITIPQLAALASLPFSSSVSKAGKATMRRTLQSAGNALQKKDKTIDELRGQIVKMLAELEDNIVVIIDDVDRLPKEDICALFKLVNLTASFPRMTFLLSYDIAVITEALNDIQGANGASYLEKIVQLPINLPPASGNVLRKQLEKVLEPYIASRVTFDLNDLERNRLIEIFEALVVKQANTPRQVKRYLNAFEVTHIGVGEDICPADTIGMVGLQVFMPSTFEWLWYHRGDVCTARETSFGFDEGKSSRLKPSLEHAISKDAATPTETIQALAHLFPKISSWFDDVPAYDASIKRETGRVAHRLNFELYAGMATDSDTGRQELYHLTTMADPQELAEGILRLDAHDELTRLIELMDMNRNMLPKAREGLIADSFLKSIGRVSRKDSEQTLERRTIASLSKLLGDLLVDVGTDTADQLIEQSTSVYKTEDYAALSWFLRDENLAQDGRTTRSPCLSPKAFTRLCRGFVDAVVNDLPNLLEMPSQPAQYLWRHIDERIGGNALEDVRRRYGDNMQIKILYCADTLAHWYGTGGHGYGYSPSDHTGYDPVFKTPTKGDIEAYGHTGAFRDLPEEVRVRVASLYLLVLEGAMDNEAYNDSQVPYSMAHQLSERWLAEGFSN